MNDDEEEAVVIVIAGRWEISNGVWDFVIAKECYARSVTMRMLMSYEDLISNVSDQFELQEMNLQPQLSYWLPSQLSIFSVNRRPPVIITNRMGVRNFLIVRRSSIDINLLLSFEVMPVEGNASRNVRKVCVTHQDRQNDLHADHVGDENADIRIYSIESVPSQSSEGTNGTGVRRRLFPGSNDKGKGVQVDDEACETVGRVISGVGKGLTDWGEGTSGGDRTERENSMDLGPCTNMTGIISLADAATPSLSDYWSNSEDERVLREFQELEKRQEQLRKEKGKGIVAEYTELNVLETGADVNVLETGNIQEITNLNVFESGNLDGPESGDLNVESHECVTDGVSSSSSEADDDFDYSIWTDSILTDYRGDFGECGIEEGGPASVAEPEDAECGRTPVVSYNTLQKETDVGDQVLSYVSTAKNHRVSLPNLNIDVNNDQALATEDAEPVFDDVIDLTNNDGCETVSAEEDAIYIGRVFKDKEHMQTTLSIYAIKRLFHFRQTRSDPKRLIFICVDPKCRWRVFGHAVSENSKNFQIRTATLTHTCTITSRAQYAKLASAKVISSVLQGKYANGRLGPRAIDIPDIVLAELKVSVTYMKAWYAKEAAVRKSRGSDEESYKLLASYMYLLEQGNPGTIYKLEHTFEADESKKFKYLFFALGGSIAGIKHCRKVILVDGTTIKSKFKGVLLAASMQDANFLVYPIAFGVVNSENEPAWTWFFRQLSFIVPDDEDLVIVSDRHRAIYAAIVQVYPKAFHGACAVHIERNVRHFGGKGLSNLVGKAARAFNVGDFNYWYDEIGRRSPRCAAYLNEIPLEHWTQAYCEAKRYNIMSSNIAEALNSAISKILELPIVTMVESIRTKLMQWFCIRRAKAKKLALLPDPITPNVNKLMLRYHVKSAGLAVIAVSAWSYQVSTHDDKTYFVDLEKKTCTCQAFQKLLIPCCHALAAARINGIYIPSLVGKIYQVTVFGDTYAELIYPVPNQCDEVIPPVVLETRFNPPTNPPGPGRRRKRRIPSTGEQVGNKRKKSGPHKCSTCGETGHNRATCKNIIG